MKKLKEIIDLIGHKPQYRYSPASETFYDITRKTIDVRVIIFTPKFMKAFNEYYYTVKKGNPDDVDKIMLHLDEPMDYLYRLIKD